jgi:hypothetical protein
MELKTYGDLKKVIKAISLKQKGEKIGGVALDQIIGLIPGGGAAKTTFDFVKAAFSKPDTKKTKTWLDKLDIDDDMSAIVDDTVENGFLKTITQTIESEADNKPLEDNFNMNAKMVEYLKKNYSGRTVSGIAENNKKMKKDNLKQLIKEEIRKVLKEEEEEKGFSKSTTLTSLVADLGNIDTAKFNTTFNLVKNGKPLNNAANKILADTFISLMKNADNQLLSKFVSAFKKIS